MKHATFLIALTFAICASQNTFAAPSAAPPTVTTMAMQGGVTCVFQLPVGYSLKTRTKVSPNCDTMIWMKTGAATETDGTICQVSVIDPGEGVKKSLESGNVTQVAQDILKGKAQSWQEFHPQTPADTKLREVNFVRIDFDGMRNDGTSKIAGFQLVAPVKEKLVCITVQSPEATKAADLPTFDELLKSIQVQ